MAAASAESALTASTVQPAAARSDRPSAGSKPERDAMTSKRQPRCTRERQYSKPRPYRKEDKLTRGVVLVLQYPFRQLGR